MSEQLQLFGPQEDPGSVALTEVLEKYEIVDVMSDHMVVADREPGAIALAEDSLIFMGEIGYSSPSPFTAWTRQEWNPKLMDKLGITEYYRMKRVDGIIRGALRRFKTPVMSAHWFIEAGGDKPQDEKAAKFVEDNFNDRMNVSWYRTLEDILLMCDYGYMVMEKVYAFDPEDGKVILRKLAPRHPADIQKFVYDSNGGPDGIVMEPQTFNTATQPFGGLDPINTLGVPIPISRLAVFSLEAEAGDMQGISVLRSVYKHYKYKDTLYKIDAIQKERHGIGVPIIKMPPGWKREDKLLAEKIGRNLRTNERAHITLPPMWEIFFAKLEGQPVDCMKSIDHHNDMILENILAPDRSAKKDSLEMFYKATRYVAETVTDTINRHVIPELVGLNFGPRLKNPKMLVRRIGEWDDQRTQSFTLRNYVGAGLIKPDDVLEQYLRREMDLPKIDFETRAPDPILAAQDPNATDGQTADPVQPPKPSPAGPPRQGPASPKSPHANAGTDRSGGK